LTNNSQSAGNRIAALCRTIEESACEIANIVLTSMGDLSQVAPATHPGKPRSIDGVAERPTDDDRTGRGREEPREVHDVPDAYRAHRERELEGRLEAERVRRRYAEAATARAKAKAKRPRRRKGRG